MGLFFFLNTGSSWQYLMNWACQAHLKSPNLLTETFVTNQTSKFKSEVSLFLHEPEYSQIILHLRDTHLDTCAHGPTELQ